MGVIQINNTIHIPTDFELNFLNINGIISQFNRVIASDNNLNEVYIDFGSTRWFNAEFTTLIGTLFSIFHQNGYTIYISKNINPATKTILQKNGFLAHYNLGEKIADTYNSTIPYLVAKSKEIKQIDSYLEEKVIPKINYHISHEKVEVINSALFELIHNIKDHSQSDLVFMCGQYYHSKKKLVFAIADIGISIPINIQKHTQMKFSDTESVDWAVKKGNSTKDIASSGLGLYDIKENLKGQGSVCIISNLAYWHVEDSGEVITKQLESPYPGSLIMISFSLEDTSEKNAYNLDSEIDDLFF